MRLRQVLDYELHNEKKDNSAKDDVQEGRKSFKDDECFTIFIHKVRCIQNEENRSKCYCDECKGIEGSEHTIVLQSLWEVKLYEVESANDCKKNIEAGQGAYHPVLGVF